MLRVHADRLLLCTFFTEAGAIWQIGLDDQIMTWGKNMAMPISGVSRVNPAKLPGWGLRNLRLSDCEPRAIRISALVSNIHAFELFPLFHSSYAL